MCVSGICAADTALWRSQVHDHPKKICMQILGLNRVFISITCSLIARGRRGNLIPPSPKQSEKRAASSEEEVWEKVEFTIRLAVAIWFGVEWE